jgi:hypothetical protein
MFGRPIVQERELHKPFSGLPGAEAETAEHNIAALLTGG